MSRDQNQEPLDLFYQPAKDADDGKKKTNHFIHLFLAESMETPPKKDDDEMKRRMNPSAR
jgi:hypothetical protein